MSTRAEIQERLRQYEMQTEKAERTIDAECGALGRLLYEAVSGRETAELDGLSAGDVTDALNLPETVTHMKRIREKEAAIAEWKEASEELTAVKICPRCENSIDNDDLFCPVCGERIVKDVADDDKTKCPQCGNPRKEDAQFCVHCGYPFMPERRISSFEPEEPAPVPMKAPRFCFKCGEELEDDAKFCFHCGARQDD